MNNPLPSDNRTYKTPLKKLLCFFEESRNKWKQRASEKQQQIDAFKTKVRDLTKSRDKWKQKASEKQKKIEFLERKLRDVSESRDKWKRKAQELQKEQKKQDGGSNFSNSEPDQSDKSSPQYRPTNHIYTLVTMQLGIEMILHALISLRGAMYCFRLFSQFYQVQTPCWVTVQNWILRFGLYELQKSKEYRNDWIYILDHTVQLGTEKAHLSFWE